MMSLGTGAIINGARLSLCKIAMVDARSVPRYNVLTKVGFVIWERGPVPEGGELPIVAYGNGNVSVRGASSLGPWN